MLTGPTRVLASFLVIAQRTQASVERVFALIDTRSQMEDGTESINSQVVGLELENMSFDYHHGDRHILSDISFSCAPVKPWRWWAHRVQENRPC